MSQWRAMVAVAGWLTMAMGVGAARGAVPASRPSMEEQCQRLVQKWQTRWAGERFNHVVAPPFVIAGDGPAGQIARYRDGTVLAAARALKAMYFSTEPGRPVLILLFEGPASYRRLAKQWFDDGNVPHFGYFRHDDVMLMDVSTGTGTLVHEIVHALLRPDFPDAPSWFNEGLASLYEQCTINGTDMRGLENWRLPGIQRAIRAGTLRSLRQLVADGDFYDDSRTGINYAQARYLMFYLQEKGLLRRYYREFRAHVAEDPAGLKTLETVIGPMGLEEFERQWREWVMGLRFE